MDTYRKECTGSKQVAPTVQLSSVIYQVCPGCGWLKLVLGGRFISHLAPPDEGPPWYSRLSF